MSARRALRRRPRAGIPAWVDFARSLAPGDYEARVGRSVFWLPDQPIRLAFPAHFLPALPPSRRSAFEKSSLQNRAIPLGSGPVAYATVVPGYSDGLASDFHRLPSTTGTHLRCRPPSPAPCGARVTFHRDVLSAVYPAFGADVKRSPLFAPTWPDTLPPALGARRPPALRIAHWGRDERRGKCGAPATSGLRGIPPRTRRRNGSAFGHFATAGSQREPREGDRKPTTRAGRPA
jgi:hypothetical protein